MADEKKSLPRNDAIFIYAALKHLSTIKFQNKIKIYRTLQELGQKTNEVLENIPPPPPPAPRSKIPTTTLCLNCKSFLNFYAEHLPVKRDIEMKFPMHVQNKKYWNLVSRPVSSLVNAQHKK